MSRISIAAIFVFSGVILSVFIVYGPWKTEDGGTEEEPFSSEERKSISLQQKRDLDSKIRALSESIRDLKRSGSMTDSANSAEERIAYLESEVRRLKAQVGTEEKAEKNLSFDEKQARRKRVREEMFGRFADLHSGEQRDPDWEKGAELVDVLDGLDDIENADVDCRTTRCFVRFNGAETADPQVAFRAAVKAFRQQLCEFHIRDGTAYLMYER